MKKGLLISLGVIAFLFIALLLIPVLFKNQIKAKIDQEIATSINAKVVYDADKIDLSIIRHFPNLSITIGDFALIGKAEGFKGDTLYAAQSTQLVADLMSIIKGDKIKIKSIYLDHPLIFTKFTKEGKMSWDIAVPSETGDTTTAAESSAFKIGIDAWEIKDGRIIYEDESLPMYAELKDVNHKGSGDLTQETFVMDTWTSSPNAIVIYDGVKYLDGTELEAKVKMNMDYGKMVFTFMDNELRVNNFIMGFDGSIAMPANDIDFDLTYKAKETDFKNLLSLVPALYTKDYESIKTEGKIAFDGWVKGTMNDSLMPGYALNLQVNNAMFQYPALPSAVKNIGIDLHVVNKDGITENTVIDLKKLHLELDKNPVDASVLVEGLNPSKIDAKVLASINLQDLTKFYPLDSITLKGLYSIDLKAKGLYSEKTMPKVNARMSLKNGYVKTNQVPEPIEAIDFDAVVSNEDGTMKGTKVNLENFNMKFQGEPFFIKAFVENFDDPKYNVVLKGILNLSKLTKIYPLEGMKLAGIVNADIATQGQMSDVEAGNYLKTSTKGTMDMKNFEYSSEDLAQGVKIASANFSFTPNRATISNLNGSIGKSDMKIDGYVTNYMGYMFGAADSTLQGKMIFKSKLFDANEWMTDEEETEETATASADTGIFIVPTNLDFVLSSDINKVLYTNLTLENVKGDVIMKDGVLKMDQLGFNTLGGTIVTNGSYDTRDVKSPKFDMNLDIDKVGIKQAYASFATLKSFAPIAQNLDGNFSSKMALAGNLDKEMSPVMNTVSGNGLVKVASAALTGNKVLEQVQQVTKVSNLLPLQLKDILLQFEIKDGKVFVKPFDVNVGKTIMKIQGNQSISGALDYLVNMDIPVGAAGTAVNSKIAGLTGQGNTGSDKVHVNLLVGGTFEHPTVGIDKAAAKEKAKEAVKESVKQAVVDQIKTNPEIQKAKDEAEKAKQALENQKKETEERLKKEAEAKKQQEAEKAQKALQNKAKDALKGIKF